jgi:hypothetical protein
MTLMRRFVLPLAFVFMSLAIACGRSPEAAAPAPKAASSACDDYVQMVTSCIAKMSSSDAASEREELESYQKGITRFPMPASMKESRCTASITLQARQDSNGCYLAEAVKRHIQTACTLLTREELQAAIAEPIEEGTPANQACKYVLTNRPMVPPLELTVHWHDGKDEVAGARGAKALLGGALAKNFGNGSALASLVSGEDVSGVGDEAYYTEAGIHPMLVARLGDIAVGVEGVSKEHAIAVLQKALPRVTPDPPRR